MSRSSKNVQVPQEVINARRNLGGAFSTVEGTQVFPSDIGQHFMLFRFREYSATRNNVTAGIGLRANDSRDRYTASVGLPVPLQLVERYNVGLSTMDIGLTGAIASDIIAGGSNEVRALLRGQNTAEATSQSSAPFWDSFQGVGQTAHDVTAAVIRAAAMASLITPIGAAVGNAVGQINNPNTIAAFYGVQMRTHQFQWLFSPESASESSKLESILKRFKFHMLPQSTSRYFLKYPDEVDITIGGTSLEYQLPFKSCLIQSADINYTPTGRVSKFKNTGASTHIGFGLTLIETEAFTREDISLATVGVGRGEG